MTDVKDGKQASTASADASQVAALLHNPSPRVIRRLIESTDIHEEDILTIAQRRNIPPDILDRIAKDKRWSDSYPIRLALAGNPKTPLSVSLGIVRYLRLFDIVQLTQSHSLPLAFRYKVEAIIVERIPTMPLGYKKSLAKLASGNVLLKLLHDPDEEIAALCLDNPRLTENYLFKVINSARTFQKTIALIAGHKTWSLRRTIRYALIRNGQTPLVRAARFLQGMHVRELQELFADPSLPAPVRPVLHREFLDRGIEPQAAPAEEVFEIDQNDDDDLQLYGEETESFPGETP